MYKYRHNRLRLRISFLIMIVATLTGMLVSRSLWQTQKKRLETWSQDTQVVATDRADWVDLAAAVGEQVVQLFIGVISEAQSQ